MSGINRDLILDTRHIAKHLPDTPQAKRLLKKGLPIHVFNDEPTMQRVAKSILEKGEFTGMIRGYERYGLYFPIAIGYRLTTETSKISLFYGELKINAK
ncbi:MAG: hypothetical protein HC799_03785, partial [Limnothrix sp. RL_2_0]|nr:hypothetical protein [Limnothrix sp. RL_2_0]